jgi:thymidylate synthase ThyX
VSGITATVLADSVNPAGSRLTTLQLRFPRFILAEFNTHRVFSRNARSSRAVPTAKLIEEVRADPVIPVEWGKNRKGMSASEEIPGADRDVAVFAWRRAAHQACESARRMADRGVHKQIVNRLLEPWMWAHVVVSSTEWGNFFAQRLDPDAQPEMRRLAEAMADAMLLGVPRELGWGQWHLPYATEAERLEEPTVAYVSAARCARVSYAPFGADQADVKADAALADKLIASGHWSPFEHQAMAWPSSIRCGNFGESWEQHRKAFKVENRHGHDWKAARVMEVLRD